jgi:DNA polymerase/3'-5' exonuclease PolX
MLSQPARVPIATLLVVRAAEAVKRAFPEIKRLYLVGSRLRHKYGRDIDFVALVDRKEDMPSRNVLGIPFKSAGFKIDLFFATPDELEPTIIEFALGRDMTWKRAAIAKGLKLNRFGLWKGSRRISNKMSEIAAILGVPLKPHLVFTLAHPL